MKRNNKLWASILGCFALFSACTTNEQKAETSKKDPVDYVNPYMGNISHLLVPTYPTVQLPNSMLRVYPEREDFTGNMLKGLPVIVPSHRHKSAFKLSPYQGNQADIPLVVDLSYDNETINPYRYEVYLDEAEIEVDYALSHQSAIYTFDFEKQGSASLVLTSGKGSMKANGNKGISGYEEITKYTKVYVYAEAETAPEEIVQLADNSVAFTFSNTDKQIKLRYGVSFISEEQAKANLEREIKDFDILALTEKGRAAWNEALGKIEISGENEDDIHLFYTSLWRCFERPINISEGGKYFSAYDNKIHEDEGRPFYVDDWIWDTYRATHPLRILIDSKVEADIIHSFLLMAKQMGTDWMPTFPEVMGDTRRMNSNHAVATVIDAWVKGVRDFDLEYAYTASRKGIEEKTLIPWSAKPAGWLDDFYKEHGYIPALEKGEKETVPNVSIWEKRQPIAVTLGTAYDQWCLSEIAKELGKTEEAKHYAECALNYRKVFNPETGFFHPKDKHGRFIPDLDYRYDGGLGARDYYDENNGYVYRWDVQHNIADVIDLVGGNDEFIAGLEDMFNTPLGMSKWSFYSFLPDHTGNVGMFSMANEPSLHVPYLYNYAGKPWKTQKRIRTLLDQWFRNDLMGMPGDEDGGGMSAFVAFSQLGFYPVTPGSPTYNIGSPMFENAKVNLSNGTTFEIKANNASSKNKYIQSAKLNGKEWNQSWFHHDDIAKGGVLELEMGPRANKQWGTQSPPPSMKQ